MILLGFLVGSVSAQDILLEKGSKPPASERSRPRDHYTPYFPPSPEELPPGAKIHIIQKGDTLWDLAKTYLGDNYYWPQIWEANQYITDPHWIFPGDPLVIPVPLLIAEVVPEPVQFETLPAPQPVAKRYDVYCAPYILNVGEVKRPQARKRMANLSLEPSFAEATEKLAELEALRAADTEMRIADTRPAEVEKAAGPKRRRGQLPPVERPPQIIATEGGKVGPGEGDVVYLNRGSKHGLTGGDEYLVVRPQQLVSHPVSDRILGVAMQMMGTLRVLCTQEESSTAVVVSSCDTLDAGDLIKRLDPIPIPLAGEFTPTPTFCQLPQDGTKGYLVYSKYDKVALGEEDLVSIDIGSEKGLVPGDFLIVYRDNDFDPSYPVRVLGDLVVLLVEPQTATAKILSSSIDMRVGDKVALR